LNKPSLSFNFNPTIAVGTSLPQVYLSKFPHNILIRVILEKNHEEENIVEEYLAASIAKKILWSF